ncbi:MAG TPA: IS701 family transposase [Anaerolineae bacterium]|nr:IS701 family transposase [Anaerolineae bacterium]
MSADELEQVEQWATEFEDFHARFAPLFARSEPREEARRYLRGLLAPVERKNCWQMAEIVGEDDPQPMQRLLYSAHWEADEARDELECFVIERFGDEGGIGVVDETGFLKKGTKSVGVKRQYTGTAGKVENSQVGVLLTYFNRRAYTFLDRRLYLPEDWCTDEERRREAQVPDDVTFKTKPQLALEMLEHAWAQGVPMAWVTGDEVYGDAPYLRDAVAGAGKRYVLAVSSTTPVWQERPPVEEPTKGLLGRPREKPRLAKGAPSGKTVAAVITSLPGEIWQRLTVSEGEKGPRTYDWAAVRIVESRDGLPGPDGWLLARRSVSDPTDMAYYLSNAPPETPVVALAEIAAARWSIETTIEEGKGEAGLDEYEVRYWHSWHRHVTLSMMAHAWLASIRQAEGEKSAGSRHGRGERSRGATASGSRIAVATSFSRTLSGVVALAANQTPASSPQPLPAARRCMA